MNSRTHALGHALTYSRMYTFGPPVLRSTTTTPHLNVTHADTFSFWEVVSGAEFCTIVEGGRCVTEGKGVYGNNEACIIKTLRTLAVTATEFETESCCDHLTIAGTPYNGGSGPQALPLDQGTELVWTSDGSVISDGFTVCANETGSFCYCLFVSALEQ